MYGVVKKGNRYYVVIEDHDPDTGERKRRWHSGFAKKGETEDERIRLLALQQTGGYVPPSQQTVEGFLIDQWLPAMHATIRPNTHATYTAQVNGYVKQRIGDLSLQRLSPASLRAFYGALLDGGRRDGRGLAPKTVRNVATMMHTALRDAVRWGLIARNPAEMVSLPRRTTREMHTWTSGELRRFLEHVRSSQMYPAVLVIATTGMRRSEALGLTWRAVDLDAGRLEVTQTLVMVGGTPTLTAEAKTAHARRSIALDCDTVEVLRAHRKTQLEDRLSAGPLWQDLDLVFTQEDGSPVRPPWFTRWVKHHAAGAGVPQIGVHGIRHTWATLALRLGIHPKVVAERLGHSSIKITLDTYSHAVPEMEERAAQQVADLVFGRSSVEVR